MQAFKRTFDAATALVEQYNRDLAAWEREVNGKGKTKPQQKPPEKESVRKKLREMQAEVKRRDAQPHRKPQHRHLDMER